MSAFVTMTIQPIRVFLVWYGMVWYGIWMVWCGMVWFGLVWYGVVWCGVRVTGHVKKKVGEKKYRFVRIIYMQENNMLQGNNMLVILKYTYETLYYTVNLFHCFG